jgi:hypothetical protein
MSDHLTKTIEDLRLKLQEHETAAIETKKLINQLCAYAKLPLQFQDAELQPSGGGVAVRRNSFFGRPLTTCVREFLEMRKRAGLGAASIDDIFNALQEGGYDLGTVSAKGEMEQKRGVAISLAKNTVAFVRLPTGDWGLLEWYPNIKKRKNADNGGKGNGGEGEANGQHSAVEVPAAEDDLPLATEVAADTKPGAEK